MLQLLLGLHAFGHCRQSERVRQAHDRGDDLTTAALCANCAAFSSSMSSCSNQSAITQAAQACANMSTCTASESCFETNIPDCQGGGGSSHPSPPGYVVSTGESGGGTSHAVP